MPSNDQNNAHNIFSQDSQIIFTYIIFKPQKYYSSTEMDKKAKQSKESFCFKLISRQ